MTQATDGASAPVLVWRVGAIGHLRFNRPRALNAIDVATAAAFRSACETFAADPLLRVVVVSGEGRAFLAGGDVAAMGESPVTVARSLIDGMHGGLRILAALDAPVIASVHGAVDPLAPVTAVVPVGEAATVPVVAVVAAPSVHP